MLNPFNFSKFVILKTNKIITYFFSGIFILYAFAFSPLVLWMQEEAKTEMEENITNNTVSEEIITLSLNQSEFNSITWIDKKEINIKGILFDLISNRTSKTGEHILKVVADKKEKRAVDLLAKKSTHDSSAKKGSGLFFPLFSNSLSGQNLFAQPLNIISDVQFVYSDNYSSVNSEISSPPPKLV